MISRVTSTTSQMETMVAVWATQTSQTQLIAETGSVPFAGSADARNRLFSGTKARTALPPAVGTEDSAPAITVVFTGQLRNSSNWESPANLITATGGPTTSRATCPLPVTATTVNASASLPFRLWFLAQGSTGLCGVCATVTTRGSDSGAY